MRQTLLGCLLLLFVSCTQSRPHYHLGASYIGNPGMDLFGSVLTSDSSSDYLKSYFRSSVRGRTEYIYEDFDMTVPKLLEPGREYGFDTPGVAVWYAKGGFSGQIETTNVEGSFVILERTDSLIRIKLTAEFFAFSKEGVWDDPTLPDSIRREGILTSKAGYELY